jgi:metal-responsive CopG/Arc/MetJ family transcriptional regulator
MRTTVTIPSDLYRELQPFFAGRSFSQFVREAIRGHLERLKEQALAREMAEGYRAEAESPSLDAGWAEIETDGWS